jgi:phosphoglycolate phosphatase
VKLDGIQHVIWDWNGTLLDDVEACVGAINPMLRRRGLPCLRPASYRARFGFPVKDYYAALGFDMASEDWDALAKEFHRHYARTSLSAPLRAGAKAALRSLRARGIPMSVLSASERSLLRRMLRGHGIDAFFEHVYGLDDLYAGSKLELGRRLVKSIGVAPGRILLAGDTQHDFEVARDMRCRCVLMTGGHQSAPRLALCGCAMIRGPAGIPRLLGF